MSWWVVPSVSQDDVVVVEEQGAEEEEEDKEIGTMLEEVLGARAQASSVYVGEEGSQLAPAPVVACWSPKRTTDTWKHLQLEEVEHRCVVCHLYKVATSNL